MASPQIDNGFTRIANELLEAILRFNCPGNQKDIIWAVIRLSYGFSKKDASVSVSYLSKMLSRDKSTVSKDLNSIIDKKVLVVVKEADFSTPRILSLNKNYEQWEGMEPQQLNNSQQVKDSQFNSGDIPNSTVEDSSTNKENIKKTLKKYTVGEFEKFWEAFPNHGEFGSKGSKKNAEKEFVKLNPEKVSFETLITAITIQTEHKRRLREKKEFVPQFQHVERWLKNERWNDEAPGIDSAATENNSHQPTSDFMKELLHAAN